MSNYGTLHGRTNVLPIVIGITVFLSMVPASWLGWTSDLADLVRIPVTPVSHIGMMFTNWIRPSAELSGLPSDENERNEFLISERDHYRQLYHQYRLLADDFEDKLLDSEMVPVHELLKPNPPLLLSIDLTGVKSSDVAGIVELKLVRGASLRILEGDIAIVGRDIVGRISRVGMTRIELRSSTHRETGYIRAAVFSAKPPRDASHPPPYHEVLLKSNGDGNFYAEVPEKSDIRVNDLVVLNDATWLPGNGLILGSVINIDLYEALYKPARGQDIALILGSVCEITPLDEAPLRQLLTIAPRRRVRDVSHVVVLGTGEAPTP